MTEQEQQNIKFIDETIDAFLEESLKMEMGSDQQKAMVDNVCNLYKLRQDDRQLEFEKSKKRKDDALKTDQAKVDKIGGWIKAGLEACGILVSIKQIAQNESFFTRLLVYEKDGIVTSQSGRQFLSKKLFTKVR